MTLPMWILSISLCLGSVLFGAILHYETEPRPFESRTATLLEVAWYLTLYIVYVVICIWLFVSMTNIGVLRGY